SLARGLEGRVLLLRPHGQRPTRVPFARMEAAGSAGTGAAIPRRELDLDDRAVAIVDGRRPAQARVAFGTGRLLAVPVDPEMLDVETLLDAGLPMTVGACRTEQLDGVLPSAVDQECGVQVASVDKVQARQGFLVLEPGVDARRGHAVGDRTTR